MVVLQGGIHSNIKARFGKKSQKDTKQNHLRASPASKNQCKK